LASGYVLVVPPGRKQKIIEKTLPAIASNAKKIASTMSVIHLFDSAAVSETRLLVLQDQHVSDFSYYFNGFSTVVLLF
jgi:hypothetical protein